MIDVEEAPQAGTPRPVPAKARPAHLRVDCRRTATLAAACHAAPVAALLAGFDVAAFAQGSFAGRLYAVTFLLLVPGTVVVSLTRLRPAEASVRLAWSLGASLALLMLLGLVYSLALPHLGIARPLARAPLVVGVDLLTLAPLAVHAARGNPLAFLWPRRRERYVAAGVVVGLGLLPVAAAAGAERLNNGDSGTLAVAVLVVSGILLVGLVPAAYRIPRWAIGAVLYATTAALLLMTSMRSSHVLGYDVQTEFQVFTSTMHAGVWHVPSDGNAYASMLSITILPTALSTLSGVSSTYLFKFLYPLVFSLFPVLVFVVSTRWFSRRSSLAGAILVVVQGLFAADITGLARQEVGLLYFAVLVATAFDPALPRRARQVAVVLSGLAMAVSHYSTAYFAAIVLILGYLAYALARLAGRRGGQRPVVTAPVLALTVGGIVLWNAGITRSAGNLANVVSSLESGGLDLLPGVSGASFVQRFLNADVTPHLSATQFAARVVAHYRQVPYLHPYPPAVTARYPVHAAHVPAVVRHVPAFLPSGASSAGTVVAELLLVLTGVGVVALFWRERRSRDPDRAQLASLALATLIVLAVLRLSGTISSLYNAPRGQVQGAPLLAPGLALACSWLFTRRRAVAASSAGAVTLSLGLLLFSGSGLSDLTLGGGGPITLLNYGEDYQRYYFTDADISTAAWVVRHQGPGQVVYADLYGGLQLYEISHLSGLVTTVVPGVIEPGAYVLATSTNVVDGTARSNEVGYYAVYAYPSAFLDHVKNVVLTTGTTRVYR